MALKNTFTLFNHKGQDIEKDRPCFAFGWKNTDDKDWWAREKAVAALFSVASLTGQGDGFGYSGDEVRAIAGVEVNGYGFMLDQLADFMRGPEIASVQTTAALTPRAVRETLARVFPQFG